MEEIARFLARHPPFDRLPGPLLQRTAETVEVEFFPRGTRILGQGGPSRFLHLIVKGTVELRQAADDGTFEPVETLTAGEAFGQAGPPASGGVVGGGRPHRRARLPDPGRAAGPAAARGRVRRAPGRPGR